MTHTAQKVAFENIKLWKEHAVGDYGYDALDPRDRKMYESDFAPIVFQCRFNDRKYHAFKRENGLLYYLQCSVKTQERRDEFEREMKESGNWSDRMSEFNYPQTDIWSQARDQEDGRGVSFWSLCTHDHYGTGEYREGHGWLDSLFYYLNEKRDEVGDRVDFILEDMGREELHRLIRRRKREECRGHDGRGFCSGSALCRRVKNDDIIPEHFDGMPSLKLIRQFNDWSSEDAKDGQIWIEGQVYEEAYWAENPIEGRQWENREPTGDYWTVTISVASEIDRSHLDG